MNQSTHAVVEEQCLQCAVYAAFFMEGLSDCDIKDAIEASGLGCIELVSEVTKFAPYLSRLVDVILTSQEDTVEYPGVLEYEVCNPFGIWFGSLVSELDAIPAERNCKDWLANAAIRFFAQKSTPERCWRMVCAVRAADSEVKFSPALTQHALNWEWLERICPYQLASRYGDEHPDWPRRVWFAALAGGGMEQKYWQWVACSIESGLLDARYAALAAHHDVFFELQGLTAAPAHVGIPNCFRQDLVAQETLASLPEGTIITVKLLACRPEFLASLRLLNTSFEPTIWLGRRLNEFLDACSVSHDPNTTQIVRIFPQDQNFSHDGVCLTLRQLWEAVPINDGWRLASGLTLHLNGEQSLIAL